jgi:hypothetical protein
MKELAKQIQILVNVDADGIIGNISLKAIATKLKCPADIKSIQDAVDVKKDGELGPITLTAILKKLNTNDNAPKIDSPKVTNNSLIDITLSQINIHETSKNHGEGIEKYWTATSYPEGYADRQPYCAACMCWVARESGIFSEKERPKSASAFGWESWGDECSKVKVNRKPSKVYKGEFVIFSFSHIGLATSDSDHRGNFSTIEANTGPSGGREGDGVYKKTRNISVVRSTISIV